MAVDASTSRILSLHIEKEETNLGYMKLLEDMFKTYGKTKTIRSDKRKTFWRSDLTDTPLKQSLNAKCIELESSSIDIFKPHVERANDSLQKFLPAHLYLLKINNFESFIKNKNRIIETKNTIYIKKICLLKQKMMIENYS
ncbi:hypothetical protein [Mycoplasmopsis lipofaciens]|uniref:hypothetical protein n=1 Tax=Mycoplasmopsis lipofaciens TaxID=114884 RepID=UPI0004867E10|nr:hypothetical protein [Mycoplasmopsis lipofaciens]